MAVEYNPQTPKVTRNNFYPQPLPIGWEEV